MLNSKFDLYKTEWLELVFSDRNKEYGAYDLRKHYGETLTKAMGVTLFALAVVITSLLVFHKNHADDEIITSQRTIKLSNPPLHQPKVELPKPPAELPKPPQKIATTRFVTPHVVQEAPQDPPTMTELAKTAVGPTTVKGDPGDGSISIPETGNGTGKGITEGDDQNMIFKAVEVMPEPMGGFEAFAKFLQRNLHYPENSEASGKVILTFVVETDGQITNIQVLRSIAPELDAEAVRVLKKAPAWKPGRQNGHPVRVQYTIPFNFSRPNEN